MLDDSFCLLFLEQKIRIDFPKVPSMDAWRLIWFCCLVVELHVHTNVYIVCARACSLSVRCQVAMINTA